MECRPADFPHRIVETLRFADTDRNGHITSSVFAICCQSGRLALLSDPARGVTPPASQFVLARLVLDYRREMHWPGSVEIATRVEHIGRSSIILAQALFQDDRCAATAQSVAVLMDAASRRSLPIPPPRRIACSRSSARISGPTEDPCSHLHILMEAEPPTRHRCARRTISSARSSSASSRSTNAGSSSPARASVETAAAISSDNGALASV